MTSNSSDRHSPACSSSRVSGDTANGATANGDKECILCGEKDRQMLSYNNAGTQVRTFITQHFGQTILDENWICKKHLLEAQRNCNNDGYVPKWRKLKTGEQHSKQTEKCANPICTN